MHHRREHGVRGAEGSEQKRPELSVALAALDPDLLDRARCWRCASADSATAPIGRCRFMPHSLRSAMKPECISAEIERACARAGAVLGPQLGFRKPLGEHIR